MGGAAFQCGDAPGVIGAADAADRAAADADAAAADAADDADAPARVFQRANSSGYAAR